MSEKLHILGHEALREKFARLIGQSQFPQTALFYGLNGIGKRLVALEVAQRLFCEGENAPCGACQPCQMVAAGTHPDLYVIRATPPKSRSKKSDDEGETKAKTSENLTIKVEDVALVKSRLVHRPLMAKYQVVIIDDADLMTNVTANSLLKILEEPKPHQIFIQVTGQFHKILPTLRSRSIRFYFAPLEAAVVRDIIRTQFISDEPIDEAALDFYVEAFQGALPQVLKALQAGLNLALLDKLSQPQSSLLPLSPTIKELCGGELDLKLFLQCLRRVHLNRVRDAGGEGDLSLFGKISRAEWQLQRHIQKEFVLENLFL